MDRPRSLILFPGAIYHVGTRGIRRIAIVDDDIDRGAFFTALADVVRRNGWSCKAYCLMTNHYHLLVQTPEADLSGGMQRLNYLHAYRFNRRHGYTGHLFESRFFAELIEDDAQLVATAQYVELNSVRAGIVTAPEAWRWSSCGAILGLRPAPDFFDPNALLSLLGDDTARARVSYALRLRDAVRDGRVPLPGSGTRLV